METSHNQHDLASMNPNIAVLFVTSTTILSYYVFKCDVRNIVLNTVLMEYIVAIGKLLPFASLYLAHSGKIDKMVKNIFKFFKRKK